MRARIIGERSGPGAAADSASAASGSTIGSTVGQWLKLSDDRVHNLVACGAAGGVAATFNAPIAGVVFALEVILGDFGVRSFGTVVIASVTASVIGRAAFGDVPAFAISKYEVTFAEWDDCFAAGGCSQRPDDKGWGRDRRPSAAAT